MAKLKLPPFVARLKQALEEDLKTAGLAAKADYERIATTNLFRFIVLAKQFDALRPSERQDLVWRIATSVLQPEEQLLISSILTLTPEEAGIVEKQKPQSARRTRKAS
jgi:hypothetical protein